jgi:polyisoprenoid-binding protein YceI
MNRPLWSRVYIFVDKTGLGHQHGVEGKLSSGTVNLGAVEQGGEFVFDMKSFDADTDAARRYLGLSGSTDASTRQQVNQNMRAASILNVNQFPTAKFAIKSATASKKKSRDGSPIYEFVGEFTLRGRTQPLKFEAEVETKDNMAHVKGKFAILQTQYGITPFRKALGAVGVADQLVIHGDLWVAVEPAATSSK